MAFVCVVPEHPVGAGAFCRICGRDYVSVPDPVLPPSLPEPVVVPAPEVPAVFAPALMPPPPLPTHFRGEAAEAIAPPAPRHAAPMETPVDNPSDEAEEPESEDPANPPSGGLLAVVRARVLPPALGFAGGAVTTAVVQRLLG